MGSNFARVGKTLQIYLCKESDHIKLCNCFEASTFGNTTAEQLPTWRICGNKLRRRVEPLGCLLLETIQEGDGAGVRGITRTIDCP